MPIRTLDQLIADLDTRQRESARSRNRVVAVYVSVPDTVSFSSDALILTTPTAPFLWGNLAGSTARTAIAHQSEWG